MCLDSAGFLPSRPDRPRVAMPPRKYPDAEREGIIECLHGQCVADPYRWLEDAADHRTLRWTAEQETLYHTERAGWPDADRWHARLAALATLDRVLTPKVRGDRVFVARQRAGQELPVLFARDGGAERPLVDPNVLDSSGGTTLGAWQPSVGGDRVAYQISRDGTEDSLLHVLDVATGLVIDGPIDRVRGASLGWLPDGKSFYYVRCLPAGPDQRDKRYHRRVWLHKVGSDPDTDILVFGEGRGKTHFYSVAVTGDGRWLTIRAAEGTSSAADIYLADLAAGPLGQPELRPVQQGEIARTRLHIAPGTGPDGVIWLRTSQGAPCGRVMACSAADPASRSWRQVIAERPGAVLTDFVVLNGPQLARPLGLATRLRHAVAEVSVHDMTDGRQIATMPLPGAGTIGSFSVRPEGGHEAWFSYTDFGTPPQVMHYDARTNQVSAWPGGAARPSQHRVTTRRESFSSRDGATVRMFAVSAAGRPDRPRPTILYGYGGFGSPMTPKFSPEAVAWVSAGGVFAVACVRGGGEEGEQWHRDGLGERKQNSFDDFAAAADHLVAAGWTEPGQLAVMGGSNGGLLVGAALTQHPEKYAAAVCMSPLLDMVRYELSGLGPSWAPEYGSASDPGQLRTLLRYSPYHQVRQKTAYPAVLFTTGDGDTRVDPLHARKMCAAMQHASSGPGAVLFRLERGTGHGSRATSRRVQLYAESLAFLGAQLGLPAPPDGT
jgi:prolyl oligopeptidase